MNSSANYGRAEAPGHLNSPGVQHSSTAEIAAQQLSKHVLHLGAPPVFRINQPFLLVVWDYSIRCHGCQEIIPVFFPKANITAPNTRRALPGAKYPCRWCGRGIVYGVWLYIDGTTWWNLRIPCCRKCDDVCSCTGGRNDYQRGSSGRP